MKNKPNLYKVLNSALYIVLILLGYGAGYTTHELVTAPNSSSAPYFQRGLTAPKTDATLNSVVCFTPNKKCQTKLIEQINNAKTSIYVQAYSFTDREIAQALADSAKRGVDVRVILDKSNESNSQSAKDIIINDHIPIRFDYPAGIAHNKIMIIDKVTVATGSYNFSESAHKRNTENLLIINNEPLAREYMENWLKRWSVSKEPGPTKLN